MEKEGKPGLIWGEERGSARDNAVKERGHARASRKVASNGNDSQFERNLKFLSIIPLSESLQKNSEEAEGGRGVGTGKELDGLDLEV